jgi:hypothetical protein
MRTSANAGQIHHLSAATRPSGTPTLTLYPLWYTVSPSNIDNRIAAPLPDQLVMATNGVGS